MSISEIVRMFCIWVARIALYLPLLALRVFARLLLLVVTALPILVPALALLALFQWLPDADFDRLFGEHRQFMQTITSLMGAGLFVPILKALGKYARSNFLSLVKMARDVLQGPWHPGWEVGKSFVITWRDNIAKIPGNTGRAFVSASGLTLALLGAVLLTVVAYPLVEPELKTVDRYVVVVGLENDDNGAGSGGEGAGSGGEGAGSGGEGAGSGGEGAGSGGEGAGSGGEGAANGDDGVGNGGDDELTESLKAYMRTGTVFSLSHLRDAQMKSGKQPGKGICLDKSQQEWLRAFRIAILECVKSKESGSAPTFEVEAFASVAPVRLDGDIDESASATLNCEIANRRADAVGAFLAYGDLSGEGKNEHVEKWSCPQVAEDFRTAKNLCHGVHGERLRYPRDGEQGAFEVLVTQWTDPEQMHGGKPADDGALPDERRSSVEILNRSVHIRVPEDFCRVRDEDAAESS